MVFDALSNSKNVLLNSTLQANAGSVSSFDRNDYYRFQVNGSSSAYISLNGLTADANLVLLGANGQQLIASTQSGNTAESINVGLSAGTYYIQVTQRSGNTLYNLSLSSNALFANINDSVKFFTGDFNGDNLQDAIRQEQGSLINGVRDTQFYLGTNSGGYAAGIDISNMNTVAGNVANLIVGDFNGDGRDDLIRQEFGSYVNGVSDTQILTFQNGNFQLVGNIANMPVFNGNVTNLIAGDFNQDGRMDLLRQEKGAWVNGQNDVEIYLSIGGWNFGASPVINNANSMTGDNTRLVTSGADIMRLEFGSIVNGVSDVNFTTFANGNLQTLQNNATANFTNEIVAKPWESPIGSIAIANAATLRTIVSNQATLISPLGTTGRYSTYSSGAAIYWSAKTGSVLVTAAMENIYKTQGGSGGWLGFAIGKEYASQGGIRQDFEGGYLFKDGNQAVALRPNQTPIFAPTGLIINGLQSSYNTNSTLQLSTSYAGDSNGWNDIAKVDFWLTNLQGQRVELADATTFTVNNGFWASFQYGTTLSGIAAGNYTFRAIAYDKAGLVGTAFSQALSIVSPNVAPTNLQIQGLQASYETNATLTLSAGFVWDANGWADAAKVDFWLTNSQGQRIELSDVASFSSHDANYARFGYSTSLNGLSGGNYKLCAMAYDKAGAASNSIAQDFSIQFSDWFTQNLRDTGLINLTRNLTTDNNLSRLDMINLFRDVKDDGIVDVTEQTDLRTLINNAVRFTMQDYVRTLSSKIVSTSVSIISSIASGEMERLVSKWFLGTERPASPQGVSMTYNYSNGGLFGNDNAISYQDIRQGVLGDCYFLSSLSANALARPDVIRNMFIDNQDGTFTVRFYGQNNGNVNTAAEYVTVDRYLPTNISIVLDGIGYNNQRFAYSDDQSVGVWVALAEKAYAQFAELGLSQRGTSASSYSSIEGGWGYRAMPAISGVSGGYYSDTSWSNLGNSKGTFLSLTSIATMIGQGKALTADTTSAPRDGIVHDHEYAILSANLASGTITLYNPHAKTPDATQGVLTISYNDFRQNFLIINAA